MNVGTSPPFCCIRQVLPFAPASRIISEEQKSPVFSEKTSNAGSLMTVVVLQHFTCGVRAPCLSRWYPCGPLRYNASDPFLLTVVPEIFVSPSSWNYVLFVDFAGGPSWLGAPWAELYDNVEFSWYTPNTNKSSRIQEKNHLWSAWQFFLNFLLLSSDHVDNSSFKWTGRNILSNGGYAMRTGFRCGRHVSLCGNVKMRGGSDTFCVAQLVQGEHTD